MVSNYSINYLVKRELSELSEVGYKTKETAKKQMTKNARKNTNNAKKKVTNCKQEILSFSVNFFLLCLQLVLIKTQFLKLTGKYYHKSQMCVPWTSIRFVIQFTIKRTSFLKNTYIFQG